jgi:hypothetical protein
MANRSDELREKLLETCGPHQKADVLRALTEALISAIVETADTAQVAEHNAARVTDVIRANVHRAVTDEDRLN